MGTTAWTVMEATPVGLLRFPLHLKRHTQRQGKKPGARKMCRPFRVRPARRPIAPSMVRAPSVPDPPFIGNALSTLLSNCQKLCLSQSVHASTLANVSCGASLCTVGGQLSAILVGIVFGNPSLLPKQYFPEASKRTQTSPLKMVFNCKLHVLVCGR